MVRAGYYSALGVLVIIASGSRLQSQSWPKMPEHVSLEIAPVPAWVKPLRAETTTASGSDNAGTVYLLFDQQENLERNASYYHEVRKITSENGVQNSGSLSISFNPAFERLIFHSIQLTRGGAGSNRLDRSRMEVLPREKDPQRSIYDTSYSAQITLEDVRVGDVIEFAYTIEGANPLMRGKYSGNFAMQWGVPVSRNVLRFVFPASRTLLFREFKAAPKPNVSTTNKTTEVWYEGVNVPPRLVEEDVPDGYRPRQRLVVSEFQSWAALAEWAMPLVDYAAPRSAEFRAETARLREIANSEDRVVAALQFVQNEIRSVGVASWLGSRPLTAPDEVLRRRFANYFDKALLLVALLRAVDIDAVPALVSDTYRGTLTDQLPAPGLIDHMVVQVRLGNNTHWIDPWRSAQRGPLSEIYISRLRHALVMRPGTKDLSEVTAPPGSMPARKVTENYRIPAPGGTAELDVITEYSGLAADQVRSSFRESTREEIQKRYLQFYARTFSDVRVQKLLWFEEITGRDACRVTESYEIPNIWELDKENNRYLLIVRPNDINSALGSPPAKREDPLRLDYPLTINEEVNVQMFEPWPVEANSETTANEFFRVTEDPLINGAHLQFRYSFELLKDRIEVNELAKFGELVDATKDRLGYSLKYTTPEQQKANSRDTFNWVAGAAAGGFFATSILLAVGYFRKSRLGSPRPPPIDAPAALNGIGGWLIVLAIGHVVRPFTFIKTGMDLFATTMHTEAWRTLTDPIEASYHSWWAPTLLFELVFNIACFVFSFLLLGLFFRKRASWPRSFVIYLVVVLSGMVIDVLLTRQIPAAAQPYSASLAGFIVPVAVAAVWIPYVYRSKRVKATFRY